MEIHDKKYLELLEKKNEELLNFIQNQNTYMEFLEKQIRILKEERKSTK